MNEAERLSSKLIDRLIDERDVALARAEVLERHVEDFQDWMSDYKGLRPNDLRLLIQGNNRGGARSETVQAAMKEADSFEAWIVRGGQLLTATTPHDGFCIRRRYHVLVTRNVPTDGNNIPASVPAWVENPYKLVSLGDFMEMFRGYHLVRLGLLLDQATVAREAHRFKMTEEWWATMNVALPAVRIDCELFGLTVTVAAINRLEKRLHDGEKDLVTIVSDLNYIQEQVGHELDSCLFLYVPSEGADYYENPQRGWQATLDKFPSTMLEVEEASKCFALGRYTACVFHAMRTLEAGLNVLADEFGVSTAKANWHNILDVIGSEINKKSQDLGANWPDQQFYSEAALEFRHFKNAWRNHVMHLRLTFDEERARKINDHVRDFMTHLSTKLSESP